MLMSCIGDGVLEVDAGEHGFLLGKGGLGGECLGHEVYY